MLTQHGTIELETIQGEIAYGKVTNVSAYPKFSEDQGGFWYFWVSPEIDLTRTGRFKQLPKMHDRDAETAVCFGQQKPAFRNAVRWGRVVKEASGGEIPEIEYHRDIGKSGIPEEVVFLSMQGRCSYLDLMGMPRARIAELAGVTRATLRQYLSRYYTETMPDRDFNEPIDI